jgi:hypothetical protein
MIFHVMCKTKDKEGCVHRRFIAKVKCDDHSLIMQGPAGAYAGDLQGANPQLSKGAAGSRGVTAGDPAAKL